jgi:hypothetical protein
VPVQGPVTTNDHELRWRLALAGVGLIYALEPLIAPGVRAGHLRMVVGVAGATVALVEDGLIVRVELP